LAPDSKLKQAGQVFLQEFGGAPGNSLTSRAEWLERRKRNVNAGEVLPVRGADRATFSA
jgi:hypothetical protein